MRILHYISHVRRDDLLSQYLSVLTTAQENLGAEVSIATKRDDVEEKISQFHPHIVHIHTLWSLQAADVVRVAKQKKCGVIISPHGQLDAFRSRNERRGWKKIVTLLFQRRMIRRADALIAATQQEAERLEKQAWNDHIDTIGNALLASRISQKDMAVRSLRLYQKVIDTRYAAYLTKEDREAVGSLLHAAIDTTPTATLPENRLTHLRTLDAKSWRRICLWADDEDVMPLILQATQQLAIEAPVRDIDPTTIDRFPLRHPKRKGKLPDNELLHAGDSLKDKWQEVLKDESEPLRQVVTLLLNARKLSRRKELSLRHVCDLYQAIKFLDYDEDQLKALLTRFSAVRFSRKVVGLLGKKLLLEEGFMPLPPKRTHKII